MNLRAPAVSIALAVICLVVVIPGCGGEPDPIPTVTKGQQEAASPQEILQFLKDGNARFARGERLPRNDLADARQTATGQAPIAAFVACIDSRVAPDIIFDLGLGIVFSANSAGNVVSPDVLGGLEYACAKAGSKVVVVLGHTSCGAVMGACDGVELGNLTQLLAKIQPAIDSIPDNGTPRTSKNHAFTTKVSTENVRRMVKQVRADSPVLRKLEAEGKILILGAVYDVETSLVKWL